MTINPDACVSEMVDSYLNGNRRDVIEALANDHPGLTAFFIHQLVKRGTESDLNRAVNALIDRRWEIVQGR